MFHPQLPNASSAGAVAFSFAVLNLPDRYIGQRKENESSDGRTLSNRQIQNRIQVEARKQAIVEYMVKKALAGGFSKNARLANSRELADLFGITPSMIRYCTDELIAAGYLAFDSVRQAAGARHRFYRLLDKHEYVPREITGKAKVRAQ